MHYRGLLILDDLGAGHHSPAVLDGLARVVEHRHEQGLRMLVTTNLNPRQLQDLMPRATARLAHKGRARWLQLPPTDYRQVDGTLL